VSDFVRCLAFYDTVLVELGCKRGMDIDVDGKKAAGYSPDARPMFWICDLEGCMNAIAPSSGFHLAFSATTRSTIDAVYTKALASGARNNGKPGLGLPPAAAFIAY
jgi:hypothetical protein